MLWLLPRVLAAPATAKTKPPRSQGGSSSSLFHLRVASFPCRPVALVQKFNHHGHNGYENNGHDDQSKVIFDNRNIPKEVASEKKDSDPDQTP
jgi:hypothetical protein